MSLAEALAVGAAWLQVLGYLTYLRRAMDGRIEPNPTSWLMWAYGTALVVVIQADRGVGAMLLLLPTVCAACSVLVAWLCWRRGSLSWPTDDADRAALAMDLGATGAYAAVSALAAFGHLAVADASGVKAILLACVVTSTVVSFVPILRSTRQDPSSEDGLPWAVWTVAYSFLLAATLVEEGASWSTVLSWAYPALCMGCSGLVGWWAMGPQGEVGWGRSLSGSRRSPSPTR